MDKILVVYVCVNEFLLPLGATEGFKKSIYIPIKNCISSRRKFPQEKRTNPFIKKSMNSLNTILS